MNNYVGKPLDRVDGRLKVTGAAKYAAEFDAPKMSHAVLVLSTIAKGAITAMDTSEAEKQPGVIAVITPDNMPKVAAAQRPLFDKAIHYSGQSIAVVVAETLEEATRAADLVHVTYAEEKPAVEMEPVIDQAYQRGQPNKRGDFDAGLAGATHKVDHIYRTPIEHHNPMEPHATVAVWNGDMLTAYDSTQGVSGSAQSLARRFGIGADKVRVIDPFVGGGFGCKGQSWPHSSIAAMAAQVVNRPVKLALTRRQMFTSNGHRPPTRQAVILGAGDDGKLTAHQHYAINHTSRQDEFVEGTSRLATSMYSCANVNQGQKLLRLDVPGPTYARAPGESTGSFSIETAMDELAAELGVDPIELRLRNYAEKDEASNRPYSSKSLKECYRLGAEKFGWSKRNPKVGSMTEGRYLVGYGMASATYPANFWPTSAKAVMTADGKVQVQCGTQDLGTGTYTILGQIAADAVGVKPDMVRVEIGDSWLPNAPGSGGSNSATSAGSAVMLASQALKKQVVELYAATESSPLSGHADEDVEARDGKLTSKKDPTKSVEYAEVMKKLGKTSLEGEATARPGAERGGGPGEHYTMQGFGAQFCEVHVDPDLRMVRVARWVGAFGLGKVLNEKTLVSQLKGGVVWGIGMGLLEETIPDATHGRFVNCSLADYHVPVSADVCSIDIILVPEEDKFVSPIGAKGAGEIGITGAAAAIGNAIYHATGKRVRDLPITLNKIL